MNIESKIRELLPTIRHREVCIRRKYPIGTLGCLCYEIGIYRAGYKCTDKDVIKEMNSEQV